MAAPSAAPSSSAPGSTTSARGGLSSIHAVGRDRGRDSPSHDAVPPKLLPQSPQDSPVRAVVHGAGHSPVVAPLPPRGGDGGGRGNSDSDAAAVVSWEIEHGSAAAAAAGGGGGKARLADALAPALLQKFIFGLGASFGFNALVVANGTLMEYYEERLGLSTSFLSLADFLTGALTLYAVVGFGYLSDVTTSSWGRRKPYVVFFTPILAFSLAMLFAPGLAPSKEAVPAWFGVFYALEQVTISAMTVVIAAWGTSLTHAAEERAALYTIDACMDLLGFLTGVLITAFGGAGSAPGATPRGTGAALALIFLVQNFLLVRFLRDEPVVFGPSSASSLGPHSPHHQPRPLPFVPGLHLSLRNAQFLLLFKAASFGSIVGTTVNLLPIFLQVVMGVPDDAVEGVYSRYVQAVVASAFVAVLATGRLNARFGKVRTLQFALACGACYGVLAFLASYGKVGGFYVTAVPAGFFAGITMVNGNVLLSNSIDYDELKTGFRRQSLYQCLIYVPMTFVSVAGSSIPLSIITAFGGLEAGRAPPAAVVQTLRLWISLIVAVCLCLSYQCLSAFKLTEAVQEEVSAQLRRREEGEDVPPQDLLDDGEVGRPASDSAASAAATAGAGAGAGAAGEGEGEGDEGEGDRDGGSSNSATHLGASRGVDLERQQQQDGRPSSSSGSGAGEGWMAPGSQSFLELYFSARELALLTLEKGKRYKLCIYAADLAAAALYAALLLVQAVATVRHGSGGNLTAAEVVCCLFMLASGLAIYEGCRLGAMREIYAMPEREVARWARRRLTERKDGVSPRLLRNPFILVRRALVAHAVVGIGMIFLLTSLPAAF